jgi:hypothetical protein
MSGRRGAEAVHRVDYMPSNDSPLSTR